MLIFLDLETTGLERTDRICEVGLIMQEGEQLTLHTERIKPPRKIRPGASALHHITNEALTQAPTFEQSQSAQWLKRLNDGAHMLVSHHIAFDLQMLENEGVVWQGEMVDTLKCARVLIDECESHALQFLRYELRLYRHEEALSQSLGIPLAAHSAASDALHVKMLYDYLGTMSQDLATLSKTPQMIKRFMFGKYKGRLIEEIALREPGYLRWMLEHTRDLDEDLRYSLQHYLGQ